jgi:hypothetical protein
MELSRDCSVAYVANPAELTRIASRRTYPIGFPLEDVFRYDPAIFAALSEAHGKGDAARLRDLWGQAELDIESGNESREAATGR